MCSSSVATVSMLIRGSWYNRFDIVFSPFISYIDIYFVPPAGLEMRLDNDATHLADAQSRRKEMAKREKEVFRGHPEPRQRTPSSALLVNSLPAAAKREKGVFGTRYCIPRMRGSEPRQRTPSSALLFNSLPAAAKREKGVFGDAPNPGK